MAWLAIQLSENFLSGIAKIVFVQSIRFNLCNRNRRDCLISTRVKTHNLLQVVNWREQCCQ